VKIASNEAGEISWPLSSLVRHGLVSGGSGSGKSVSLKLIAERLSENGVPCLIGDVKGDLGGFASKGELSEELIEHCRRIGVDAPEPCSFPVEWWCPRGKNGRHASIPLSKVSPEVLGRVLDATPTQQEIIKIIYMIARDYGFKHDTPFQIRDVINWVGENQEYCEPIYGKMSSMTLSSLNRKIIALSGENKGLFGKGGLNAGSLIKECDEGRGVVSVLDCSYLYRHPVLYAIFMIWILSDIYDSLPELGRVEKPVLVLFFDEAHLIFRNASKPLLMEFVNIVRLIRSKGIGVVFASQSPADIPDDILGQLGSRIQHAMRGATPKDMAAVRTAARSMPFPRNKEMNPADVISVLATGEALVSFLKESGEPMPTERAWILPPSSHIGPARPEDSWQAVLERRQAVLERRRLQEQEAREAEEARKAKAAAEMSVLDRWKGIISLLFTSKT